MMTLKEANSLDSTIRKISENYWLGTVYNEDFVWFVGSSGNLGSGFSSSYGVRPVIEISTSEIQ